jgi:long-chain acyl-CoA synthetase
MAAHLQSLGYPPGTCIAMISKNCAEFITAELAIWMAGYVSVALFPTFNADHIDYILQHSESKLIFIGKLDSMEEVEKGVPADMPRIVFPLAPPSKGTPWSDIIAKTAPLPGEPVRLADDLALIIYTSGTTGRPKGVMHSFKSVSLGAETFVKVISISEEDRILSYLPLAHAFERAVVESTSFLAGFHIYFAEALDTFIADLKRAKPTIFISVPRLWLKFQLGVFAKQPPKKLALLFKIPVLNGIVKKKILTGLGLEHVRVAASGSAPIPPDLIQWYRDLGLELLEGYGMSENFSASHISVPGKTRVGYVGNASPGVRCKISPEGEVLVDSPGNMVGYYKEPEMSRDSFTPDGFLKTGDRGELDAEGRLRITGRVKELFKTSKGKYVAPAPIENLINADGHVELSCVAGSGQSEAHAVVLVAESLAERIKTPEGRAELEPVFAALLKSVNAQLEDWEQLGFLAIVQERWGIENGFLTPSMKLKRSAIESAYQGRLDEWYGSKKKVIWA